VYTYIAPNSKNPQGIAPWGFFFAIYFLELMAIFTSL